MARLVIVAGPAFRPTSPIHFPPILIPIHPSFPPLRPGLSLWQVPPHPHLPTSSSPSLPLLYLPGFHILMHKTRLATVASLTFPPSPLIPILIPTPPHPIIPARLVIVAGLAKIPPHSLCISPLCIPIFNILFVTFFGPAYHCGRSRLPHFHYLPFTSPCLSLLLPSVPPHQRPGLSLWQVPPPPFTPSPGLFPSLLSPSPLLSLSPLAAPRAPVAMVDPK